MRNGKKGYDEECEIGGKRRKNMENNNSVKEMKEHTVTCRVVNTALVTLLLHILCSRA
jgi:hypothetical protein